MRRGDVESALAQMRGEYAQKLTVSHAMELGVGYLWIGNYQAAWEHFHAFNGANPFRYATTYGMAGVAKWCLGQRIEAVHEWREGLRCQYVDWAGGIKSPLLLFFSATVDTVLVPISEVKDLLAARGNDVAAKNWPGPLGRFVLGRIDEAQLRRESHYKIETVTTVRQWTCDFWVGVIERHNGRADRFLKAMNKVADVSWADFDQSKDLFLSKLWQEELFLARQFGAAHFLDAI